MYVLDATPLISLAAIERVSLVESLDGDAAFPERVYEEVVTAGIESGHADARRVERAVDDGRLAVESAPETGLAERLRESDGLSDADVAVLALADHRDGVAVMDERHGRAIADAEGIPTRGTAYVVLHAQKRGVLDAESARATIDDLVERGWYCSTDLYARIRQKIDAIDGA